MRNLIAGLVALAVLSGCGAEPVWAPDDAVQRAAYRHDGPPEITLFTVVATRDGSGGHSGLLINGSERVMFDPAGTWRHPALPERNDVFFGVTPAMVRFYIDYHARVTYDVVEQRVAVSPEVAELVLQRALEQGPVPKALCTQSITEVLRGVPGFEGIASTYFPVRLQQSFAALPGVVTRTITDTDADDNHGVLLVQSDGSPAL